MVGVGGGIVVGQRGGREREVVAGGVRGRGLGVRLLLRGLRLGGEGCCGGGLGARRGGGELFCFYV